MSWAQSISVYVAAKKAGVNTTTLPQEKAARVYLMARELTFFPRQKNPANGDSQCIWIEGLALAVCLTAIKISILLFYNRIFTIRPFRLSVYFAIIILTGWGVSTFVVSVPLPQREIPASLILDTHDRANSVNCLLATL